MTKRRAELTPDEARVNAEVIAEIERVAALTHFQRRNDKGRMVANHTKLAIACGLSRGGFDQIYSGGGARPETLLALAKFARAHKVPGYEGAQPQRRLYRIMGWWDEETDAQGPGAPAAPPDGARASREAWEIFERQGERRQDHMLTVLREIEAGWL